jgi:hypothetical protein
MPAGDFLGAERDARGRSSAPATADANAGALISGRYRVEHGLGKGGMASVWAVRDEASGRRLALKRLSNAANAMHVALFEREFHILASLHHPCIVEAYDYGQDRDGRFYTMELLNGSDVSQLAPVPWPKACRILRDVASGLTLLHARRLIHRDLSARNVWLAPNEQVKLIDFGTMATFGKPSDIAGTPPFIAPETLHGLDLDQRTDLYSLGALGYFLLTGRHAFRARSLHELESLWRERPRSVAKLVAELARDDLPQVPLALETLLETLLSRDPLARPTRAADVIDRLTVIASLEPDKHARLLDSYLSSPAFVGRETERRVLRDAFARATGGQAARVIVESAPGLGRTRLLTEFALEARLSGAVVLQAEALADSGTHAIAQAYALRLLDELPSEALAAAAPYASVLGHLSPALRERLGLTSAELAVMAQAPGEARMRVQVALRDWFLDVARKHLLVIVADDFDIFDDGSAAWLAALGREADTHQLLAIAAIRSDRGPFGLAIQALRQHATCLELAPLSFEQISELFRSVFGDVQHLVRLSDLIYQRSEGNPAHALDLAEHLSREGVIGFTDGVWVLPQTIAAEILPANRLDTERARLGRLSAQARELGRRLSVREGPIPLDMCAALSDIQGPALFDALESLVREGVLVGSADGHRFARESLRAVLCAELDRGELASTHRRLGSFLLRASETTELERLKAGVHLLLGGDDEQGSRAIARAAKHYGLVELADLGPAAPSLEVALAHLQAAGRPAHELVLLLAPLALAGYYADRRLAVRYGEPAVDLLQTIVGLKNARRLRPFLGRKLGLFAALGLAAFGFALRRKNPRVPSFREAMMLLFNCVAALTGVCTICIDPVAGEKYASVLEPMTALGPNHVATFMHQFCLNLLGTIRDRPGEACENWRRMIERLDRPRAVRDLPEQVHVLYLAGALYARGVAECWRDDSQALALADRLQSFKLKLYEMSADQVRMTYYANRGSITEFERYRQRVEVHAIQRGTAWQVETWSFSGLITVYARTQDAAGLKDCMSQLERLSHEMGSLRVAYARARTAYLVVRGTPSEALESYVPERPLELVGWCRGEGLRARAYNALGDHARAKETCLAALGQLAPADLEFCALNLNTQIELARAEAGLGNLPVAEAQLRALLERHGPGGNLLTLGALHEALAELALLAGDKAAFVQNVDEVGGWFRDTRDPALVARHERLTRVGLAISSQSAGFASAQSSSPPRIMTVVHRLRHGGDHTRSGSAEWALKQLSELTGSKEGYLFLAEGVAFACAARIGPSEDEGAITNWVCDRLAAFDKDADMETYASTSVADSTRLELGERVYRLTPLFADDAKGEIIGAVLLSGGAAVPSAVIRTISERLGGDPSVLTNEASDTKHPS